MCQTSMPAAPNPTTTAQAQTASNIDTAKAQATLNNVNQVTPYGNLTYTQNGTDTNGVPRYTATQTLSPVEQQLLSTDQGTQQTLASTANTEAGKLKGMLNTPIDLSQSNLDNYTDTHFLGQFNQQQDRAQEQLNSTLANQGIQVGSTAWNNAQDDFSNQKNDALNNMLSQSDSNAQSAILAQRETPLNEIIGLASGSQVGTPSYVNAPQTSVAGTDVAGITNQAYQGQLAAAQYQNQQSQSLLGGLFGLGSNALLAFSDARLKDNIEKVGELPDRTNVYEYDFRPTGEHQIGVVAQEVEKTHPKAVHTTPSGYKAVDYNRLIAEAMLKRRAA